MFKELWYLIKLLFSDITNLKAKDRKKIYKLYRDNWKEFCKNI